VSEVSDTIDHYISLWNETDADARRAGISRIFADDATYTDPLVDVSGHAGINAVIAATQGEFAGFTFKLLIPVDSNHNIARFSWELIPSGGSESIAGGSDVAVFDESGRIANVYGFLDKMPAA